MSLGLGSSIRFFIYRIVIVNSGQMFYQTLSLLASVSLPKTGLSVEKKYTLFTLKQPSPVQQDIDLKP